MFEPLSTFPLIVARLNFSPSHPSFRVGELRLKFDSESINGRQAQCEVLLARFHQRREWDSQQRVSQLIGGSVTVEDQGDGVLEIKDMLIPAALQIIGPAPTREGVCKRLSRVLSGPSSAPRFGINIKLVPESAQKRTWRAEGTVSVLPSSKFDLFGTLSAMLSDNTVMGVARLFRADLMGKDAAGEVEGGLHLRLVPVPASSANNGIPASFISQVDVARQIWAQGNIVISAEDAGFRIPLSGSVKTEVENGIVDNELAREVAQRIAGRIEGVPVVLVDNRFTPGGGERVSNDPLGSALTAFIVITNDNTGNPQLLAHEIGHILGGEHDGEPGGERWAEAEDANSVMLETGSVDIPNPPNLGPEAIKGAARWAFFNEVI